MVRTISLKNLLISGIAAGIFSPLTILLQAFAREGFHLAVHPISMLSLGEYGWIQTINYILSGLFYIIFAIGLRLKLKSRHGGVWGSFLFAFSGSMTIVAGFFTVDPMLGFPPGTPAGLPSTLSWHAQVHNMLFIFIFLGQIIVQFVFARRFALIKQWGFAIYCALTALATPILIVLSELTPSFKGYILFGTGILTNVWVILLASKLLKEHDKLKILEEEETV